MELAKHANLLQTHLPERASINIYDGDISVVIQLNLSEGNYLFGINDDTVEWSSSPGQSTNEKYQMLVRGIKDWLKAINTEHEKMGLCAEFTNRIRHELLEKSFSLNPIPHY